MNDQEEFNDFREDGLYFIPLGGCQQFGINLNVYGAGGKWLAVDCGIGFTDDTHPGVDLLLPDPQFLEDNQKDLLGIVVTHIHEDHIGAIPYVWSRLKCPVYCTPFAAAFLRRKCSEFEDMGGLVIHEIQPDQIVQIGPFKITAIGVTHSTPGTVSFTLETKHGLIVHGNEWNLDPTPPIGGVTNREAFKGAGRKGVLAYVGDSTNAPFSGRAVGEATVQQGLENVFRTCTGRVLVTIFASNVARIISVARAAQACGRQVALAGRSLFNISGIAGDQGYLAGIKPFLSVEEAAALPPAHIVYLVTGSQGEPRAAMARVARNDYRGISIGAGDTAIFSSRAIPGNEKAINAVKNDLLSRGVTIIDADITPEIIHASGHPYREEISDMLDWVRPNTVIPIHGERVHLEAQAAIARGKQIQNVIVPMNGDVIDLSGDRPEIVGRVPTGVLAVEPGRILSLDHPAIAERRHIQSTGALHITAVLNKKGRLAAPIQVSGIGIFDTSDAEDMKLRKDIEAELSLRINLLREEDKADLPDVVADELRLAARRMAHGALGFKPKVTAHVVIV